MLLKTLKLCNVFQYSDSVFSFQPGINFIVGPNGSGKTNILNAILFAMDGNLPHNKSNCIRYDSVGDSYVEMEFEEKGKLYRVTRYLNKNIAEVVSDGVKVEGIQAVNEFMENLLNVSSAYIRSHVYLAQGGLGSFLNCTASERAERIWDSMRLERLFNLWTKLGSLLSTFRSECSADYSREVNELMRLEGERITLRASYERAMLKQEAELHRKRKECEANLQRERKALQDAIKDLAEREAQLKELKVEEFEEDENFEKLIANYNSYNSYMAQFNRMIKLFRERPSLAQVNLDVDISVDELKQRKSRLLEKVAFLKEALKQGVEGGSCVLCGSKVGSDFGEKLNNEISGKTKELKETDELIKELEEFYALKDEVCKIRHSIRQAVHNLRTLRAVIGDPLLYNNEKLKEYQVKRDLYKRNLPRYNLLKQNVTYLSGQVSNIRKNISYLESELSSLNKVITLTEEQIEDELAKWEAIKNINDRISILEEFRKKQERNEILKDRLKTLEVVREVFSRNSLISLCVDKYLRYINNNIVTFLEALQANYNARLTRISDKKGNISIRFEIRYKDGKSVSEDQLSYGERLVLSLAYHLTTNLVTNVDILLLDEPTLGLDEVRLSRVPYLLLKLSKNYKSGLQIICSTHEKDLISTYQLPTINLWGVET